MQSEVVKGGLIYREVLERSQNGLQLQSGQTIGLEWGIIFRRDNTRAVLLEVPSVDAGSKADALAKQIISFLPAEAVRITSQVRCGDVRITGLDDTVDDNVDAEAVARVGACSPNRCASAVLVPGIMGLSTSLVKAGVAWSDRSQLR